MKTAPLFPLIGALACGPSAAASSTETSESTGDVAPFGPCPTKSQAARCESGGGECFGVVAPEGTATYCATACTDAADCEAFAGATPVCLAEGRGQYACAAGQECPLDATCVEGVCSWFVP